MKQIYIIYNPNSTGDGHDNAKQLQASLKQRQQKSRLIATRHAGHARELAQQYAGPDTVIVSSSGDGGFNEVVNGVLTSQHPETIVGLLPSGNANDHYSARHQPKLVDRMIARQVTKSDVIKVTWLDQIHYAHSYAGLGVSADIAEQLTEHDLNPLLEAWLVLRNLLRRRPLHIRINGRAGRYDSLICSVSPQMAKYLNLPDDARRPDGHFAIIRRRAGSLTKLIRHFLHLSLGKPEGSSASQLRLQTIAKTNLQLDGEIFELPANCQLEIVCLPGALHNII